jgi:glyoxylase-like metal-dependent hydrolase (beta-lactamase superfamily II)
MAASAKDLLIKGENDFTHGYYFINKRIKVLVRSMKRFFLMITAKKHIAKESNLKFPPYWVRGNDILITKEAKLIEIGINLKGRIIETPGHTIDSISVLLDDGNCFVGDAAANLLRFAGTKYCVIGICDLEEYYRSWQRILEEGAKHIFPAHGKPFAAEKLRENIGKNKKKNMVMIRSRINE